MECTRRRKTGGSKRFVLAYFLFANLLMVFAVLQPGNQGPGKQGMVAVVSAPWSASAAEVSARAGGQILSTGFGGWLAVSTSDEPDYLWRLYSSGAFYVASALVAEACLRLGSSG
ncbi:hypothetical protein [Polymorphum gilvum]|uniref:Uncharacterized protein n=1 Tax=Polymorphum gilvum (strain LMG 25793 / CGMCC 1.9160 / SL003B-26A1) TaxID=991905 RepID=F2J3M8_POLGS|nr:hypothetical protein [Polymorphum gilvum]ADZ72164.1 hypothetical protein SL003B_3743 [Polymorphum gilvum SL003B-26A1]